MKSLSEMSEQEFEKYLKTITPIRPHYMIDGNHGHEYVWTEYSNSAGHKAKIKEIKYIDKKGKEKREVCQVIWEKIF